MVASQAVLLVLCVVITCQTLSSSVVITPRKQIIKKKCIYDRDCPRNAFCYLQQECACKEDYFIHKEENKNEICLKRVQGIGDACTEDSQCQLALGNSAECRRVSKEHLAECTCRENAHLVHDRCFNTSRVGERCVTKDNCVMENGPMLSCVNGVCECPRNQHASSDRNRCIDDRYLGDECYDPDQCVPPNSRCTNICECRIHFVVNEFNSYCIPVADSVGDVCEEDAQCRFVPNSWCSRVDNVCTCEDGFHPGPWGKICYRDARLNEDCDEDWDCIGTPKPLDVPYNFTGAECFQKKCHCVGNYKPSSNGRYCENNAVILATQASWLLLIFIAVLTTS